ncbi:DUF4178 domain-containing protein [Pseudalkalibacillus caeni]|uniref:DUF4178 domain-containing protein n=1 Tax=Exobacillus caeni TaxID=2574798 RepID=A0A5R9FBS6_9BACL|nr:DUF4178 domain-containing protein [Pseudalkalibacillus caeni]TLS39118.1 DUF4178 domain-containing protein [Pseudalkalibacillus caeni]
MSLFSKLFKKKQSKPEIKERNLFNMKVNDIVTYELEDFQVVGKLRYNDHGYEWIAYQLLGSDETLWLSVEMDDELELAMYKSIKHKLSEPIPEKLDVNGTEYFLDEKGQARVQGEGRGKNVDGREVKYYDFANEEEDKFLSIEVWGSEVEVSEGYEIDDYEIKILAAS